MAQEKLDAVGLHNLHVAITDNKRLAIKTECGRYIVTVFGIEFTRRDPVMRELEYAVELFDSFLVKHIAAIKTALDLEHKLNNFEMPSYPYLSSEFNYGNYKFTIELGNGKTITFKEANGMYELYSHSKLTLEDINKLKINQETLKRIHGMRQAFNDRTALEEAKNAAWSTLNTCDI